MSHEWKGTHLWVSVGFPLWFELHWIWWANQICKEQLSRLFCRNHCILTELVQVLLQTLAFCLWSHCFVLDSQWPFLWRSQWWKPLWRARISKLYGFRMTIHVVQIRWFDDLQSLTRFDVLPFHVAFWNIVRRWHGYRRSSRPEWGSPSW